MGIRAHVAGQIGFLSGQRFTVERGEREPIAAPFLGGQLQTRILGIGNLDAAADHESVVDSGPLAQLGGEARIHRVTVARSNSMGDLARAGSPGGIMPAPAPGGLLADLALFDEEDRRAFAGEEPRRAQTDDAAADDQDVRVL